jgi:hypothetical protein
MTAFDLAGWLFAALGLTFWIGLLAWLAMQTGRRLRGR